MLSDTPATPVFFAQKQIKNKENSVWVDFNMTIATFLHLTLKMKGEIIVGKTTAVIINPVVFYRFFYGVAGVFAGYSLDK